MAYNIIIQEYWTTPINAEENSKFVMAGVDDKFNDENAFKKEG